MNLLLSIMMNFILNTLLYELLKPPMQIEGQG